MNHIQRALADRNWLQWSTVPFSGALHDFNEPLRKRFESRKMCGPYYMSPATPGKPRGFYMSGKGLACSRNGAMFDLRLEDANDHLKLSRLRYTTGYYCAQSQDSTLQPIIARLPRSRGFLAGWTMGAGMIAALDLTIHETEEDAARAAHGMAEHEAEEQQCAEMNDNESEES